MAKDILVRYYTNVILAIKCAHVAGRLVLAKPALLLGTIDAISKQKVVKNKLFYDNLKESYSNVCNEFRIKETPMNYPYYFLASESFWNLHWNCDPVKTKAPSEKMLHDKVDYAHLDNALWDLLQDAENRARLREAIVNHFFDETEEKEQEEVPMAAEPSNTYGEEEATPRQLWALRRATGIDYRGRGLTKAEASEMIGEAMKKAEEQGVDVNSNEPTTRQLNYLKRATGIDYSTKGLTKAEATKMIRELKEVEKDDNPEADSLEATDRQIRYLKRATGVDYRGKGLTKRKASKMIQECIEGEDGDSSASKRQKTRLPEPEPGTLEYILSKCKTREEQLEAARKFFGEDK